jgi:hypothetical protein
VSASTPPKSNELEISIIGPGLGECLIIHLGDSEWCVVDSCIARGQQEPVALEYLKSFGPQALNGLKLVVATHWHNDHIRGLARIVAQAPHAEFCCSMALRHPEFRTLVASAPENIQGRSGVEELANILTQLQLSNRAGPVYAVPNRKLFHSSGAVPVTLTSLSPSDPMITSAMKEISKLLPKAGEPQERIVESEPNHASVVLWLEAGDTRALLGADLEHTNRKDEGWMGVISQHKVTPPALVFKVPHHGSSNGYFADVWTKLLTADPFTVVTPFGKGSVRLPQDSDLVRLSSHTNNLFCTSRGAGKPPVRDAATERWIRTQVKERRVIEGQPGHVRIRWSIQNGPVTPSIELFNGAYRVQ